jgi:hypothetical protein
MRCGPADHVQITVMISTAKAKSPKPMPSHCRRRLPAENCGPLRDPMTDRDARLRGGSAVGSAPVSKKRSTLSALRFRDLMRFAISDGCADMAEART